MQKSYYDFTYKNVEGPAPTIELFDGNIMYDETIKKVLVEYAKNNPDKNISLSTLFTRSYNFNCDGYSLFILIRRAPELRKILYKALKQRAPNYVRYGEQVMFEDVIYHIENGQAWERDDLATFTLLK